MNARTKTTQPKVKLPRIKGRIITTSDDKRYRIELREDGLRIRRVHCRTVKLVTIPEILNWRRDQMELFPTAEFTK